MDDERGPFFQMLRNIETFDPLVECINACVPIKEKIIELNRDDQLYEQGIRADGTSLPAYKQNTIQEKEYKGQRFDHMTLRDTQHFQSSMKVEIKDGSVEIVADDEKVDNEGNPVFLKEKYGEEILGLTDENLQFIIDKYIRPSVQDMFGRRLFADKNTF